MEKKFSEYQIKDQISNYLLTFIKQATAPKTSELDQQGAVKLNEQFSTYLLANPEWLTEWMIVAINVQQFQNIKYFLNYVLMDLGRSSDSLHKNYKNGQGWSAVKYLQSACLQAFLQAFVSENNFYANLQFYLLLCHLIISRQSSLIHK